MNSQVFHNFFLENCTSVNNYLVSLNIVLIFFHLRWFQLYKHEFQLHLQELSRAKEWFQPLLSGSKETNLDYYNRH